MLKQCLYVIFSIQCLGVTAQVSFTDITESLNISPFESVNTYGSGVCAIDSDGDGDIDLYLLSDEHSQNQYYSNDGNGGFILSSNTLAIEMRSRTALWFDFDGDHLLDVFIAGDCSFTDISCLDADNLKLFKQSSINVYDDQTSSSGLLTGRSISGVFGGLAAGDFNNDGSLDLVTTQWGGEIKLWLNKRDGTFEDGTESAGLEKSTKYWQPLVFDLNQDGWMDIYLTVDNQPNLFYKNNHDGTFQEMALSLNLGNNHNDMGITLGDFDADQDFDIYITNIEKDGDGDHNILLNNELQSGTFDFNEVSISNGIDAGGWGWGCTFLDADNDGFLDLGATNGWVTDFNDQSKFWKNDGSTFEDLSEQVGFNDTLQATTLVSFDMDRDGDLDMAQTLKNNPDQTIAFRLLENKLNESAEKGNYLVVKPRMIGSNHWAIGSTVRITTANSIQSRPITAGISFYGQEPAEAHFGLGDLTIVEKIEIVWPGGETSIMEDVSANQIVTIDDGDVLHAPGGVTAIAQKSSEIKLDWGQMTTSETGFLIERSISALFDEVTPFNISNQHSFLDTGLDAFTTYHYRIKANNATHESDYSHISSARTDSDVEIHAPSSLTANLTSLTSVELSWQDLADNEDGYTVQRSLSEDFNSYFTIALASNSTSLLDENIEPHTTYYYRVRAYRDDGESDFSSIVMVETVILGHYQGLSREAVLYYPTPDFFQLSIPSITGDIKISVINLSGQEISHWAFENSTTISDFQFSTPSKKGLYFVIMQSPSKTWRFKLLNN